jgi:hypothetical protein
MKNESNNQPESLWRRQLSQAERAELRSQPELELEARLTETLVKIPNVPVPSNFTARVLDAIEFEENQAARAGGWRGNWNWRFLWPRVAMTAAVLVFAGLSIARYEASSHQVELTRTVAQLAMVEPVPNLDALENWDAIQRMSQSAHADTELLADLQ